MNDLSAKHTAQWNSPENRNRSLTYHHFLFYVPLGTPHRSGFVLLNELNCSVVKVLFYDVTTESDSISGCDLLYSGFSYETSADRFEVSDCA